jgi:hypothetical protein
MAARFALALAALLIAMPVAQAQMAPAEGPVIPRDGSPVTTSGRVTGFNGVRFNMEVEAGEEIRVDFRPANKDCQFSVLREGSETPIFLSTKGGNQFAAAPPAPGLYTIHVFQRSNPARRGRSCDFEISFSAAPR